MREVSPTRFNAMAGYARQPMSRVYGEEVAYFESSDGSLMGMVIRDRSDNDFSGILFGRDKKLRFRWTSMTDFFETKEEALDALEVKMEEALVAPAEEHHQGDEVGDPVDFFTPVNEPERLNPHFMKLVDESAFSPAKEIIEPMMRWYEDADGNFVEQFQTTGFDQRIWELYLFSMLIELGYVIDREKAVPDFCCRAFKAKWPLKPSRLAQHATGRKLFLRRRQIHQNRKWPT